MNGNPSTVDPDKLATVEAEIGGQLDRLASLDEITKDDLEAFRRSLPTDPMLAEAVQLALPYPWSDLYEYVEASERQPAYWRASHDRQAIRSAADREHKQRFGRAARAARGVEGTVDRGGRSIPASAAHVADAVAGEDSTRAGSSDAGERALRRLRELLGG